VPGSGPLTVAPSDAVAASSWVSGGGGPANPQDLNRYAYGLNNPVRNTDPTGHCIGWVWGASDCTFAGADTSRWDYSGALDNVQTSLDVAGMIPVAGEVFDGANAAIYAARGDAINASLSAAAMVPGAGNGATAAKLAVKYGDEVAGVAKYGGEIGGAICSFSSDTPVLTDEGAVFISKIKVGDTVIGYHELLRSVGAYTVTAVHVHVDPEQIHLTVENEQLTTTPEHPFYVMMRGWVPASHLHTGDFIRQFDGSYGPVRSIRVQKQPQVMYNLTVSTAHTFFVGNGNWLVHNTCLQTGGNKVRSGTAKALNELHELSLHKREWGRALEALKKDLGLGNNHHGKIMDSGDYLDGETDEFLGNLLDYIP
jgi:hypothetical protein